MSKAKDEKTNGSTADSGDDRFQLVGKILHDGYVPQDPAELDVLSVKELATLYNKVTGESVTKFSDKKSGIRRLMKAFESAGPVEKPAKTKSKSRRSGPSKFDLLRSGIRRTGSVTMQELITVSGFDRKNVSVGMAILRNPSRTKDPIMNKYDRKTQTFTIVGKNK